MMSVTLGIGNSAGIGGWKYNAVSVGTVNEVTPDGTKTIETVDFYLTFDTKINTIIINPENPQPTENDEQKRLKDVLSGFTPGDIMSVLAVAAL